MKRIIFIVIAVFILWSGYQTHQHPQPQAHRHPTEFCRRQAGRDHPKGPPGRRAWQGADQASAGWAALPSPLPRAFAPADCDRAGATASEAAASAIRLLSVG